MSVFSSWRRLATSSSVSCGLVEAELAHQRALLGARDLHAQRLGLGGGSASTTTGSPSRSASIVRQVDVRGFRLGRLVAGLAVAALPLLGAGALPLAGTAPAPPGRPWRPAFAGFFGLVATAALAGFGGRAAALVGAGLLGGHAISSDGGGPAARAAQYQNCARSCEIQGRRVSRCDATNGPRGATLRFNADEPVRGDRSARGPPKSIAVLAGKVAFGGDPRSEGGRGPEVLPSRSPRSRTSLIPIITVDGVEAPFKARPARPRPGAAPLLIGRRAAAPSSCGRSSSSGSIAGSSPSTKASAAARPGLAGDPLAQRRPGLRRRAPPSRGRGSGTARRASRAGRRAGAWSAALERLPPGAFEQQHPGDPVGGWRIGRRVGRRGAYGAGGRTPRPAAPGRRARPPPPTRQSAASSSAARRRARGDLAQQLALQHAVGQGGPERPGVGQEARPALRRWRSRGLRRPAATICRDSGTARRDRAARTPRRRARARSCPGRARRAGTGSGSCACRWRAAGWPRAPGRRRGGRRRRRRS